MGMEFGPELREFIAKALEVAARQVRNREINDADQLAVSYWAIVDALEDAYVQLGSCSPHDCDTEKEEIQAFTAKILSMRGRAS